MFFHDRFFHKHVSPLLVLTLVMADSQLKSSRSLSKSSAPSESPARSSSNYMPPRDSDGKFVIDPERKVSAKAL